MRHRAFTMAELIVTMAVIAALIGLLAPALAGARASARSMRCQLNLRQMATAAQVYAVEYDVFPAAIRYEIVQGVFRQVAWDWVTTTSGELISPGALWSYTNNPDDVQQCPEFHGSALYSGDPYTGYNYNTSFIGAEGIFPLTGWDNLRKGVPPHACRRACHCAMFGDGGWKNGANKFMRAPAHATNQSPSVIYSGGQAFRHTGCTNVAYVDGHIGTVQQAHPGENATDDLLQQIMNFPMNGFLSNDNAAYDPR